MLGIPDQMLPRVDENIVYAGTSSCQEVRTSTSTSTLWGRSLLLPTDCQEHVKCGSRFFTCCLPPEFPSLRAFPRSARHPCCVSVGAYGIGEVVTPVLDYLGCFYSSTDKDKSQQGASDGSLRDEDKETNNSSAREMELLELYRRVLDGHGAAPGP